MASHIPFLGREWAAKGPSFAGNFTIAEWGCGTECEQIAIVDDKTGDVFDGPLGKLPRGIVLERT